jgi:thioglycine synthase
MNKSFENYYYIEDLLSPADLINLSSGRSRYIDISTTLRKLWPLKEKLGVSRITDLTEFDYIGISVVSVLRPNVNNAQITATQGKGIKKNEAIVSALMEAVERFSCASYQTCKTLEYDPNNEDQMLINIANKSNYQGMVIDWVKAINLFDGQKKYILAADVLFPYHPKQDVFRLVKPSTSGLSAGNTKVESIVQSIYEVIERDTTSKFIAEGYVGKYVDADSINSAKEKEIIHKFRDVDIDINIYDLSEFSLIPVFYVSILNSEGIGPNIACGGQGAHLYPQIALRRALTEAAQSRIVALQGGREDLIRHNKHWQNSYDYFKASREYKQKISQDRYGVVEFQVPNNDFTLSIKDQLNELINLLKKSGHSHIYYTDLTNDKINIPVSHISIPGFVDKVVDPTRERIINA